ncbi:DNA polymerase III subunit theta [Enterobacillus tribolii]|uniref:Uncharacterized protein n=1 Tax=Enterobacillus tribolii TaxID=1487935 RepID=A0A370R2U0_9GAMM|nr:DNA polymerase III subunit theta [Enterobacillus tribolii]MBW7984733.1 DNA polymerase III subunit theta [Enterobacillus tribolii]RDK96733.1 hypothetical protein C8D90_101169 [Enterobacillus tribolii]
MGQLMDGIEEAMRNQADFMASTYVSMKVLGKEVSIDPFLKSVPDELKDYFLERTEYYHDLYKPIK